MVPYRQGSDPRVDTAIAMRDPLNMFLQQEATQITTLEDSKRMLAQIVSAQPVNPHANVDVAAQNAPAESMVEESPGVATN